MAGVILYGLMRKIRSSRQLEYACGHNVDFMWLAEGRRIDHSTFCEFRTKFKRPLKELFKQVNRVAMKMGFIRLLAPNYTPLAATDGSGDFIVDCDVIAGPNEQNEMLPSADRIEENYGKKIENLSARRPLRSSRTFLRCVASCCEVWKRCERNGAGCRPPTT
jgi:hypothetical protein